jgi:heme/copper-type cytochrome/quinol oxidase subunit 1
MSFARHFVKDQIVQLLLFLKKDLLNHKILFIETNNQKTFFTSTIVYKIGFLIFFWFKIRTIYYVNNWIYTTNHKRIAVNYFWFVILSGIVGMVLATLIRLEFAYPGVGIFAGDSIQYLSLATAHGVIMVFFMIMPLIFGAFANFLLPTQLGVHDVAFPRLNSAAFWFLPGGLLMLCQLVCVDRRYQRMNCFNIREIQSILKRKFFDDLVNTHDHHTLLDKTVIGLRYKTNDINPVNSNIFVFYNYGIEFSSKIRNGDFSPLESLDHLNSASLNTSSRFFKILENSPSSSFFYFLNNVYVSLFEPSFIFSYIFTFCKKILTSILSPFITTLTWLYFLIVSLMNWSLSLFSAFSILFKKCEIVSKIIKDLYHLIFDFYYSLSFFKLFSSFNKTVSNLLSAQFDFLLKLNKEVFWSSFWFNLSVASNIWELLFNEIKGFINFGWFLEKSLDLLNKLTPALVDFLVWSSQTTWISIKIIWDCFRIVVEPLDPNAHLRLFAAIIYSVQPSDIYEKKQYNYIQFTYLEEIHNFKINYDSYTIYIHSLFYLITNTPFWVATLLSAPINPKNLLNLLRDMYTFFTNWYFPLLLNDNFSSAALKDYMSPTHLNSRNYIKIIFRAFYSAMRNAYNNLFFEVNLANIKDVAVVINTAVLEFTAPLFTILSSFISLINLSLFNYKTNKYFSLLCEYFYLNNPSLFNPTRSGRVENDFSQPFFISNYFSDSNDGFLNKYSNQELSNDFRYLRFANPVFKYDYKSGDYFPKLYKEVYTHLFTTLTDLTSGLRTASWFFSDKFIESLDIDFLAYFNNVTKKQTFTNFDMHSWAGSRFSNTHGFYNLFFTMSHDYGYLNKKWISLNVLNQKFHRMFTTSSMQQRIYTNWRQLKFTREAWRCKLLAARHQKTLFRRYVHEDGVFWSIERNAKDLLPGWAMITPFSSRTRFTAVGKTDIGLLGVLLVLNSSIISAANFLVTYRYLSTLNNRKMRDARAFFTEGVMVASWMMIAANPMLVIGIIMLLSDRHWQTSFFDYSGGGDTVLFQHMFWFFGHPEVYVIIIPTFGFTNTILSYYLKKRISARASLMYSMYTIAFLGFFVWGHHMYMVGLAHTTRMLFSTLTVMISVPAATKIMHWCVTIVNSSFATELPLLFIITFIFFFISGGISGMCVAHTGMDVLFHDTFYVIAHFHVMFASAAMFACFGAFYFYFPAIFGVKYSRIYAYLHYTYYLIGQLMTVVPMFWLGYAGMPRRVLDYPASMGGWHSVISSGHMLSVAGLMAFFIMIFDSLRQGRAAIRTTFGISRFNTRLNFYIYEAARLVYSQQKGLFFFKLIRPSSIKLNGRNFINFEPYETVLISYVFINK